MSRTFRPMLAFSVAAALVGVLALDCGTAAGETVREAQASRDLHYVAIGDSAAAGVGSSQPCAPFAPCKDGTSYAAVLAAKLRGGGDVRFTNMGMPGAVLSPTVEAIASEHGLSPPGNFVDDQMPRVPHDATLITIFGGGNDVNAIARAVDRGAGADDLDGYVEKIAAAFARDYARLIEGVRERAPNARIVALNLPNLALLPYTAPFRPARRLLIEKISAAFSRATDALADRGVRVVDVMCDPRAYDPTHFASDGFHPNDLGYSLLADKLAQAVEAGDVASPPGSCTQPNALRSAVTPSG